MPEPRTSTTATNDTDADADVDLRPPATLRRPSQRRRQVILDAARSLLRSNDIADISLAVIADEADVSVATIYNLVGNRDEVFLSLLGDYVSDLEVQIGEGRHRDPLNGIVDVGHASSELLLADPEPIRQILRTLGPLGFSRTSSTTQPALIARIERARRSDLLAVDVTDATIVQALVMGYRGTIISWSLGLLDDDHLVDTTEAMALHVLSSFVGPDDQRRMQRRIRELAGRFPADQPVPVV